MDAESAEEVIVQSRALLRAGKIGVGLQKAMQAIQMAQVECNPRRMAEASLTQSEALFRLGQYDETVQAAQGVLELVDADAAFREDKRLAHILRANAYLLLGWCASETGDLTAAETFLHRAILFSRLGGEDLLLVRALHGLSAGVYTPRGQFSLSLSTDEEALQLAQQANLTDLFWGPLTTMSWTYLLSARFDRSASYLAELRQIAQPGSMAEGWADCIAAFLALEAGEEEQSADYFRRTRLLGETLGLPELTFFGHLGPAQLARVQDDFATARLCAKEALGIGQRIGHKYMIGIALVEMGRIEWDAGEYAQAETHWQTAIEPLTRLEANLYLARARLGLAALAVMQKRPGANRQVDETIRLIRANDFSFLLEQERPRSYPVLVFALASRDPVLKESAARLLEILQTSPPPRLRIKTLGKFQVWRGSRLVPRRALQSRRAGELLILLLLSPYQRLSLETAAETLFPAYSSATAMDLIHQAASALRHALEPDLPGRFPSRYMWVEEHTLVFSPSAAARLDEWADFAAFEAACRRQDWEAALRLYGGDFLPEASDWSELPRQRLRLLYQRALLEAARRRFEQGQSAGALELCQKLLALEPWQEQAVLLGMQAAVALGDRATAYRLYRALETSLREELGVAPQAELQEFFRSITNS